MKTDTHKKAVEPLQKVALQIEAGTDSETPDLTPEPLEVDFVFGIGATGLTPFEYQLAAKSAGDVVRLRVSPENWREHFGHISLPGLPPPALESEVHLTVRVQQVRTAEGREVVKALAAMAECGSGCDCDCGCGGHGAGPEPETDDRLP